MTLRRRAYQVLERAQPGDTLSKVVDLAILALIVLNILALMLETIPALAEHWGRFFELFNTVSVIIFTVEYLLRIWASAEADTPGSSFVRRLKYIFSIMAIIDMAAILPFYLELLSREFLAIDMLFLRSVRLMRVLRIFKIGRYSNALGTMARVFRKKRDDLLVALLVIAILLVFFANLMYHIESTAQPGVFTNAFQAMWWGIVTVTGVGYGDIYPVTIAGKIFGGAIAILGVVTVAIPIGILGSAYVEDAASKRLGRIKSIRTSDHIVVCGLNRITASVIADLLSTTDTSRIVLVTQQPNPEIAGVVYVNADWTDINVLRRLSIDRARSCIIMSESFRGPQEEVDQDMIDMRSLFTLYKVKQEFPDLHTVVEVNEPARLEMVRANLLADEIVLKEVIDGHLAASCIKIPGVSRLIYELINLQGKVIHETTPHRLGLDDGSTYADVVRHGIEHDRNYIGLITGAGAEPKLSPSGSTVVQRDDRLIYIADRGDGG